MIALGSFLGGLNFSTACCRGHNTLCSLHFLNCSFSTRVTYFIAELRRKRCISSSGRFSQRKKERSIRIKQTSHQHERRPLHPTTKTPAIAALQHHDCYNPLRHYAIHSACVKTIPPPSWPKKPIRSRSRSSNIDQTSPKRRLQISCGQQCGREGPQREQIRRQMEWESQWRIHAYVWLWSVCQPGARV